MKKKNEDQLLGFQTRRAIKAEDELRAMQERKDAAYLERNQVVAALAKCFPSGVARTAIEGWSEDWHGCVYIDLPTGQVSWHFHDSHTYLFNGFPEYTKSWDGHDTNEKYRRVAALQSQTATVKELTDQAELVGTLVSVDVSTGDSDAGNRIFGRVYGVQDGTFLVEETRRNFTTPPDTQAVLHRALVALKYSHIDVDAVEQSIKEIEALGVKA